MRVVEYCPTLQNRPSIIEDRGRFYCLTLGGIVYAVIDAESRIIPKVEVGYKSYRYDANTETYKGEYNCPLTDDDLRAWAANR